MTTTKQPEELTLLLRVPQEKLQGAVEALSAAGIDLDPARDQIAPGHDAHCFGIFRGDQVAEAVDAVNRRQADSEELVRLRYDPQAATAHETAALLAFLRDHVGWDDDEETRALNVNRKGIERFHRENPGLAIITDTPWAT